MISHGCLTVAIFHCMIIALGLEVVTIANFSFISPYKHVSNQLDPTKSHQSQDIKFLQKVNLHSLRFFLKLKDFI